MKAIEHTRALQEAIERLLEERIAEVTGEVVAQATADFEKRLRRNIASTAMEVSRFYQLEAGRDNVVITVKIPCVEA